MVERRFPWSEGSDHIFRNEGVTGSNPVSSTDHRPACFTFRPHFPPAVVWGLECHVDSTTVAAIRAVTTHSERDSSEFRFFVWIAHHGNVRGVR